MNDATLVRKNLFRKKTRAILMMVAILVAFLIYGVLASFHQAFYSGEDLAKDNRMVTVNKINFTEVMPISYPGRIRAVEGVKELTYANWFGGYFQEPKNFIPTFAVEPDSYLRVYADDLVVAPDQRQAFLEDRAGLMVGETLAQKYGWKVGDQVPLSSNIFTNAGNGKNVWNFTLRAIVRGASNRVDTNFALFHHAYYNETVTFGRDQVGWMIFTTTSPEVNDAVAKTVDEMFANSTAETSTDTEKAFSKAFAAQLGNIALIVGLVVGAAFVTILMIVGNTMVMAVRERVREVAVLKTLGFPTPRIFRMVVGESVLLAVLGGVPGLLLAWGVLVLAGKGLGGFIPGLAMTGGVAAVGVLLILLLGLTTGIVPAWNAVRVNIVTALGRD
ncbi:MAG TPA: FtsX-like permease family protein [Azospirillaceae bacterium]|nr:FtsX-like permease family protein [Azospirillaceae bacterium]